MRTRTFGVVAAACCLAVGATAAEADAPEATYGLELRAAGARVATANHASRARGARVKECRAKLADPHHSDHNIGFINVEATVKCNYVPHSISTQISLKRGPRAVGTGRKANRRKRALTATAAGPCSSGRYRAIAITTVVPAPGTKPLHIEGASRGRVIDCD